MIVTRPALLTHQSIETSTLMSGGRGRILAFSAQYANGGTYRELKPLAGDVDSKDIKTREPTNIPFVAPVQAHLRHEERRRKWRTKYLEKEKKRFLFAYFSFLTATFAKHILNHSDMRIRLVPSNICYTSWWAYMPYPTWPLIPRSQFLPI